MQIEFLIEKDTKKKNEKYMGKGFNGTARVCVCLNSHHSKAFDSNLLFYP